MLLQQHHRVGGEIELAFSGRFIGPKFRGINFPARPDSTYDQVFSKARFQHLALERSLHLENVRLQRPGYDASENIRQLDLAFRGRVNRGDVPGLERKLCLPVVEPSDNRGNALVRHRHQRFL